MSRPSRALIDLAAFRSNYLAARRLHGGRTLAVVKANAYGHGAVACALALQGLADGYAVAFLDEALALRQAGIASPILVLEGCFDSAELEAAHAHECWITVHHEAQLRALEAAPSRVRGLHAWLKLDSGMRRAGFPLHQARTVHARLAACPGVSAITLMSHLACADEPARDMTLRQLREFDAATSGLPGERSVANSAGILAWPFARRDWARPGIMLYGANPVAKDTQQLAPVMTLESEVFAVRELQAGDVLGYGATFTASGPCRVGLVAVGYADGYPRTVPTGTLVAVGPHPSRILGRVSMDMLTVDLTGLPGEGIGSRVELWGRQVPVNTVAEAAGTIAYELLCGVQRVPRVYMNEAAESPRTASAEALPPA